MFLGGAADGNEEGAAKKQTKFAISQQPPHIHNYATLNSNNGKQLHCFHFHANKHSELCFSELIEFSC